MSSCSALLRDPSGDCSEVSVQRKIAREFFGFSVVVRNARHRSDAIIKGDVHQTGGIHHYFATNSAEKMKLNVDRSRNGLPRLWLRAALILLTRLGDEDTQIVKVID